MSIFREGAFEARCRPIPNGVVGEDARCLPYGRRRVGVFDFAAIARQTIKLPKILRSMNEYY